MREPALTQQEAVANVQHGPQPRVPAAGQPLGRL